MLNRLTAADISHLITNPTLRVADIAALRPLPGIIAQPGIVALPEFRPQPMPTPRPMPAPAPQPAPGNGGAPAPAEQPVPSVPPAPAASPFDALPFPAPGDRIKADDFKALSQSLRIIADMAQLSGQLFGRTFGEAKIALAGQGYAVARVMSVFGSEPGGPSDTSFDGRRVIQVQPFMLGQPVVLVVVTEAVETRRFTPNFTVGVNYTYQQAVETARNVLGEAGLSGIPMESPDLMNLSLAEAGRRIR